LVIKRGDERKNKQIVRYGSAVWGKSGRLCINKGEEVGLMRPKKVTVRSGGGRAKCKGGSELETDRLPLLFQGGGITGKKGLLPVSGVSAVQGIYCSKSR